MLGRDEGPTRRRLQAELLRRYLERAPEPVRGSLEELARRRARQIQWFRGAAYVVSFVALFLFRREVGWVWAIPATLGPLNVIRYWAMRAGHYSTVLDAILFVVDTLATEYFIWQFGSVSTHLVMFLPMVIFAMVLYLPMRAAIPLALTVVGLHGGVLVAHRYHDLPAGPIAVGNGMDTAILTHDPTFRGNLIATLLFGVGSLMFARRVLIVLRQREHEVAAANDLIRRYVPRQLADRILAGEADDDLGHERRKLTIFFSDIKGFSSASDQLEAEELARILNEYLSEMADLADRHGGTIDKFVGDAIMIFFGAPLGTDDRDQAVRCVRMAVDMQHRMESLARKWFEEGIQTPFAIRIGINTGPATVGNFGSAGRMDYTAIGNQVNLAARLESQCLPERVLISHSTWALVRDEFECQPKGEIEVKGIHYPIKVYEIDPRAFLDTTREDR